MAVRAHLLAPGGIRVGSKRGRLGGGEGFGQAAVAFGAEQSEAPRFGVSLWFLRPQTGGERAFQKIGGDGIRGKILDGPPLENGFKKLHARNVPQVAACHQLGKRPFHFFNLAQSVPESAPPGSFRAK